MTEKQPAKMADVSPQVLEAIAHNLCSLHGFDVDFVMGQEKFAKAVITEYLRATPASKAVEVLTAVLDRASQLGPQYPAVANQNCLRSVLATIARLEAEKVKDGEALERLASGEAFDLPQMISGPLAEELRMRMDFARARLSSRAKDQFQ